MVRRQRACLRIVSTFATRLRCFGASKPDIICQVFGPVGCRGRAPDGCAFSLNSGGISMNRRNFSKLLVGAVAGILAGVQIRGVSAGEESAEGGTKHACKGMNDCKGQGGCESSDGGCAGKNSCKGHGGCATTAKHDCKGQNDCKGQGGCKSGDNGCAGKNSCKGKGGCEVPVPEDHK